MIKTILKCINFISQGYANIFLQIIKVEKKTAHQALQQDWAKVSNDMTKSINIVKNKYGI
jgi:hypothetical protein